MKKIFIFVMLFLIYGCNLTDKDQMKTLSSQYLNCNSSNITVSKVHQELDGGVNWIASCNKKDYYCEYNIDQEKSTKYQVVMKGKCIKI